MASRPVVNPGASVTSSPSRRNMIASMSRSPGSASTTRIRGLEASAIDLEGYPPSRPDDRGIGHPVASRRARESAALVQLGYGRLRLAGANRDRHALRQ